MDPRNLKISKLLFNLFFVVVIFSVFLFLAATIDTFEKKINFCVFENSCLNRWFSLVYFKVAVLVYSRPISSKVIDFILCLLEYQNAVNNL